MDQLPHIEMDCLYEFEPQTFFYSLWWLSLARVKTGDGEETHARLLIYVAVNLIDLKTKYFKDRRGLEQKELDFSSPFITS